MPADKQSFSQLQQSAKNLQHDGILDMTSFMQGLFSQFWKFNQRKGSLPPGICLISGDLVPEIQLTS